MKVSPCYTDKDWKDLDFSTDVAWKTGIKILGDRIEGRFLKPIRKIKDWNAIKYTGFSVMALDCLLIETLQQFFKGKLRTPPGKSRQYFIDFLTNTSFKNDFKTKDMAEKFYSQIRCGILHQAEILKSSKIRIYSELVKYHEDGEGLEINRKLFHSKLEQVFENYILNLGEPTNKELRENFKKKMDYICRVPCYFAYGSNMQKSRIDDRINIIRDLGCAELSHYKMVFNKRSDDGSSKANLMDDPGNKVWGVVYQLGCQELEKLHEIEKGYEPKSKYVDVTKSHLELKACTYISDDLTEAQPSKEYKKHIIEGAREHGLPCDYIKSLEKIPCS